MLNLRCNSSDKHGTISQLKITFFNFGLHLCLSLLLFGFLLANFSIETKATSTFYDNNELYFRGKLIYVSSDWGSPVDNLNGQTHQLYCNAESERTIVINPYVSNESSNSVIGYIDNNMAFSIPFGGRVEVIQTHYSGSQTRNSTAYYDVEVYDIQTNLLYRPERNDWYIKTALSALIIFSLVCVFRSVRR